MASQESIRPAADGPDRKLADRQLAALQGIGRALLAISDQLADTNDTGTDCRLELARIAQQVSGLYRPALIARARMTAARLCLVGPRRRLDRGGGVR